MKKLYLTILLIILTVKTGLSCTCHTANFESMLAWSDFVLIGHAVKNIHPEPKISKIRDSEGGGTEVIFKAEKILKGNLKKNEVIINQLGEGNCTNWMKFGETYLVFGVTFRKTFPPVSEMHEFIVIDSLTHEEVIDIIPTNTISNVRAYIKTQNENIDAIGTNSCSMFHENSKFYHKNRKKYGR